MSIQIGINGFGRIGRNIMRAAMTRPDIEVVAAFDVDKKKVGKDLAEAIYAEPNNTVRGHYWIPVAPEGHSGGDTEPRPAVVALHWLGGNFQVLKPICMLLAQQGVCSLMIYKKIK